MAADYTLRINGELVHSQSDTGSVIQVTRRSFLSTDRIEITINQHDKSSTDTIYRVTVRLLRVRRTPPPFLVFNGSTTITEDALCDVVAQEAQTDNFVTGVHVITVVPEKMPGYQADIGGSRSPGDPLYLAWLAHADDGSFILPEEVPTELPPLPPPPERPQPFVMFDLVTRAILFQGSHGIMLIQDDIDALRQEYRDFGASVGPPLAGPKIPSRELFVPSLGPTLNGGNYAVQLDDDLSGHRDRTLAAYRGRTVVHANGTSLLDGGMEVVIPQTATVTVTSAYRNPRRNAAIGATTGLRSRHVWGAGLDFVPDAVNGTRVDGKSVPLELFAHLYPTLRDAARTQGTAFREDKNGNNVDSGQSTLDPDHVHLQWGE